MSEKATLPAEEESLYYMDGRTFLEQQMAEFEAYFNSPWYARLWSDLKRHLLHPVLIWNALTLPWWWVKGCFQRAFWGYSGADLYAYCHANSRRAAAILPKMKDSPWLGCPGNWGCSKCLADHDPWGCDCKPFDRWVEALDDMIYFHRVVAGLEKDSRGIGKDFPCDLTPDEQKRYRRGKLLYMRHYESLWN